MAECSLLVNRLDNYFAFLFVEGFEKWQFWYSSSKWRFHFVFFRNTMYCLCKIFYFHWHCVHFSYCSEFQIYHYLEKTLPPNWTRLKSQFSCILHGSYKEIVGIAFDFWKSFYDKKETSSKVKLKVFATVLFLNCEKSYQTSFSLSILWCL